MKIAFFEMEERHNHIVEDNLKGHQLKFYHFPLDKNTIKYAKDCDIISVFIYSNLDKKILSQLPNLKLISTRSTGFDHIDIAYCKQKSIPVTNVPAYGERTVAEHAFALLLALARNIIHFNERTKNKNFDIHGLPCEDLDKKTLGLIGTGKIGHSVARIAKGFDMQVLAYDAFPDAKAAKEIGFEYVPLKELVSKSDFISIHLPHTKETHHLFNKALFEHVKVGSILINTSRGAIVETSALLAALKSKRLLGAGLDVLEEEKGFFSKKSVKNLPKNISTLLKMNNVIITPHVAFYSKESIKRIIKTSLEDIDGLLIGKLVNIVK